MKKLLLLLLPLFVGVLQIPFVSGGEIITGKGCYRFSDQESIAVAREIALSMAKRDALEGYAVFVNATATVDNYVLKNSIITSVSASVLSNMQITDKTENLEERKICRTIRAEVDEVEVKKEITTRIKLSQKKKNLNFDTGLHEGRSIKVLKMTKVKGNFPDYIKIRFLCKIRFSSDKFGQRFTDVLKIMYFDEEGLPLRTIQIHATCNFKDYIGTLSFRLPDLEEDFDYTLEWLD